jgi:hypothetical protein
MGRFEARISDEQAAEAINAISSRLNPDHPLQVTQRDFDAERAPAGFPDLPSARALSKRLQLTWPQLLSAAHAAPSNRSRLLNFGRRDTGRKSITVADCVSAIKRVAIRAQVDSLTRAEYEQQRKIMLAAATRAHSQSRSRPASLPTLNQIDGALRAKELSWEDALEQAGILNRSKLTRQQLLIEGCRQFGEQTGRRPQSSAQLVRWAQRRKIRLSRATPENLAKAIKAIQAERRRSGQPPLQKPAGDQEIDWTITDALPSGKKRLVQPWTDQTVLEGLRKAMATLPAGQSLTQSRLKALATQRPGIPSWSSVHRSCKRQGIGFAELKAKAASSPDEVASP